MSYREWQQFPFDPYDLILNASAVDHSDFPQQHPVGVSVHLLDAFPRNPEDLQTTTLTNSSDYIANAIFHINTTDKKGDGLRRRAAADILGRDYIFQDIREYGSRLPPAKTVEWYRKTFFTLSPRGHGIDCHRNYEAILFKSIPVIMGADETLKEKYQGLPCLFVNRYWDLTVPQLLDHYDQMLEATYDFNLLSRSYWEARRPDVDIQGQTRYWLQHFKKADHVQKYLRKYRSPSTPA